MPTILITGANRGIGLEFTRIYAAKGWDVIAAVRNPSSFPSVEGSIRTVQIDAASTTDAAEASLELLDGRGLTVGAKRSLQVAKRLQADGIKLDVVIANAGILSEEGMVDFAKVDIGVFDQHWQINVRGVLVLFQAMRPLMVSGGKFIAIGSGSGTIKQDHPPGQGTYGLTKAAINFLMRKIHFEEPDILAAALHPGWIATEMGNSSAWNRGLKAPPDDIKDTVPGMVKLIDEGDKAKIGGWTTRWNGERMEY